MGSASSVPEGTQEADTVETALIKDVESALGQAINMSVAAHPEWRQAPPAVSEVLRLIANDVKVTAKKQAAERTNVTPGVTEAEAAARFAVVDADMSGKLDLEELLSTLATEPENKEPDGVLLAAKKAAKAIRAGINPREDPPKDVLALLSAALLGETAAAAGDKKAAAKAEAAAAVKEAVGELVAAANTRGAELRASAGARSRPTVVVLTGGPGVGKTTLIEHLHKTHGWPIVPEAAIQAIEMLNKQLGKEGQKAWRSDNVGAFGDMVGRVAMKQEENAVAENAGGACGVVIFDRTVLDNLGYSLQKGYPLPKYLTMEVAANAVSRIDHVLVLDQVASTEDIEARNKATGRKTDPKASVAMSACLEQVYTDLGCCVSRLAAGTTEERAEMLLAQCGLKGQ